MNVPSTYARAERLPAGAKAAQRNARFEWIGMERHPARCRALVQCSALSPMRVYRGGPRKVTLDAMVLDGLLFTLPHVKGAYYLTGWGLSVREAGTRTPMSAVKPWCDLPRCPDQDCNAPCGTKDGESIAPGDLRCACCGNDWTATPGELAQALEADAAWETEQLRQEARP